MIYILLIAGGITAALNEWIDAGVIFGVVLVNAIIGFLQESKAAKALEALAKMTVTEASILRSGEVRRIPSVELVPGDIVLLQSGDKVPADLRLFRSRDLQIDESTLTGESVPVQKEVPNHCRPKLRWPNAAAWRFPRRWSLTGRGEALCLPQAEKQK